MHESSRWVNSSCKTTALQSQPSHEICLSLSLASGRDSVTTARVIHVAQGTVGEETVQVIEEQVRQCSILLDNRGGRMRRNQCIAKIPKR